MHLKIGYFTPDALSVSAHHLRGALSRRRVNAIKLAHDHIAPLKANSTIAAKHRPVHYTLHLYKNTSISQIHYQFAIIAIQWRSLICHGQSIKQLQLFCSLIYNKFN